MLLIIDNFDSFTFNLADYLYNPHEEVVVISYADENLLEYAQQAKAIVFSPGPGHPDDYPLLFDIVNTFQYEKPLLGICLGMQVICKHFGWGIKKAIQPMHGKVSRVELIPDELWDKLPIETDVMRYHSLVAEPRHDSQLTIIAKTAQDEVMAVKYKNIYGIQFHPESILSLHGKQMLENWLEIVLQTEKKLPTTEKLTENI